MTEHELEALSAQARADSVGAGLKRNLLVGLAALLPIALLWAILERVADLFPQLAEGGELRTALDANPFAAAIVLGLGTLVGLLLLGWLANTFVGRRVEGLPVLRFVYSAQRQLLETLQDESGGTHPVVLVEWQSDHLRHVAILTRTIKDADSGEELAAVYLLGSPNPLAGQVKIVPMDRITRTKWTPREALSFVVSGGAVAPEKTHYRKGAKP